MKAVHADLDVFCRILDLCGVEWRTWPWRHCENCPLSVKVIGAEDKWHATFSPADQHMYSLEINGEQIFYTQMGAA